MAGPSSIPKHRRPLAQYAALAVLCVIALTYQARYVRYAFPYWFSHENAANWPFLIGVNSNDLKISYLTPEARAAGLHEEDTLLAVNGRPVAGTATYGETIAHAHKGDELQVTVQPKDNTTGNGNRTARIKLTAEKRRLNGQKMRGWPDALVSVLLVVLLPLFCLLLGFWVVAVRPRDPLAWLLLAVMLSFTALPTPIAETWEPGLRNFGAIYHSALASLFEFWMLLFGIYFPEPFPANMRPRWWEWCKWIFGVPLVAGTLAYVVFAVGLLENYAAFAIFGRWLEWADKTVLTVCGYGAMSTFFACLWIKSSITISPDAKRRLRLLYAGAAVAFTPILILSAIAMVHNVSSEQYFPEWLALAAYFCVFLFPITLAYVIVVHKAMNVSVVIRRGLQYTMAHNSIRVLRFAIVVVLGYTIYSLIAHVGHGISSYFIIGVGVAIGLGLRRLTEKLARWTDRHFFRDVYQAEQILADLSENVRGIVETNPLLQTVSERISESLHVPQVAVLIRGPGPYRPAFAVGYATSPDVVFAENAGTVQRLREEREPAQVYLDDPDSWIYRTPGVSEEERAKLAILRAELLLPLSVKDKLLGFISLSQKRSEEPYSGADLRLLKSVAAQAGLALENSRLTAAIAEEVAQREKLNREVEIAREVQERLFPQEPPQVSGLDYCGRCRPALGVGGDYYDFLALPGGRLGIALADVSGKGIAAALMMASLEASLRGEAMRGADDLASQVQNVNRLIYDAISRDHYATLFYAQYDALTHRLSYVNAGHNPPMLFHKNGNERQLSRLDSGGTVVGMIPQFSYHQTTVELNRGDLLVMYTDGVSEAMNPAEEEWGEERMTNAIERCDGLSAAGTVEQILLAADEFSRGAKQHDDMTLVVLRVL